MTCDDITECSPPYFIVVVLQVKVEDMDAYAPNDLLVVTTGSQVSLTA